MPVVETTFKPQDGKQLTCRSGEARTEYNEPTTGLRLRVTVLGARAWGLAFWSPTAKATRRLKIGNAAVLPLKKARELARDALHAVDEGRDPATEKCAQREAERQARRERAEERARAKHRGRQARLGEIVRLYIEFRRTTPGGRFNRKASMNTVANWNSMQLNYLIPLIGDRAPADLTSGDLLAVLEAAVAKGGPSMGPKVRELLEAA